MNMTSNSAVAVETVSKPGAEALALRGVVKSFPGVKVLKGVEFICEQGEIHALLGENGAGKSTLVNIASGNLAADEGTIAIAGTQLVSAQPSLAHELGLAVAYQDDSLIPDLTVTENLILAAAAGGPTVAKPSWKSAPAWAVEQLARFNTAIDPATPVRELPVAARAVVEIVKALLRSPRLLILDEPTAALTSDEASRLHEILRAVAQDGVGIVYITHRLVEVMTLADRVSVLRDGVLVAAGVPCGEVDEDRLVELMVGRSLETTFPLKADEAALGEVVVSAAAMSSAHFTDVSLAVRRGEIVGLAGVEGNGQREVLRALAGLEKHDGVVAVAGNTLRPGSVRSARSAGVSFVSGDRRGEAVYTELSVRDNLTIGALRGLSSAGIITKGRERSAIAAPVKDMALRSPSVEHIVGNLSGGNQQKVAIGRALLEQPAVYLIEEPTQGVDAGTRLTIYAQLRQEAEQGAAIVVLSSDALELAGLCDRVIVFSRGHQVAELSGGDLDETSIVGASARSDRMRSSASTVSEGDDETRSSSKALTWARRSDLAPVALLTACLAVVMTAIGIARPEFLSSSNITSLLFLAVPIGFAALAQGIVMLTGGIDLSVGPVISFVTVVVATLMVEGSGAGNVLLAIAGGLAAAVAVGLVNAALIRWLNLQPLIATLATYITVQGLALVLMPVPGGYISQDFAIAAGQLLSIVPLAFVLLLGAAVAAEFAYRRSLFGLRYRAVGARPTAARRVGVGVQGLFFLSYVAAGAFAAVAGLFYAATIQIGDPTLGVSFTLASVTAVVLGGMSTWGGRGSLLGAVAGALLLAVIANGAQFLNLEPQVQYFAQAALLIGSIALYSLIRSWGMVHDETTGER